MDDEYDPDGRFAWDMIRLTEAEIDALVAHAEAGESDEAEAVVDRAEDRMYGELQ